MDRTKKLTLAITIVLCLTDVLGAASGLLPPAWALLLGVLTSAGYSLARGLQKVRAGSDVRSLLLTSEFQLTLLTAGANLFAALAGLVPADKAAAMVTVAAVLAAAGRRLHTSGSGTGGPAAALVLFLILPLWGFSCATPTPQPDSPPAAIVTCSLEDLSNAGVTEAVRSCLLLEAGYSDCVTRLPGESGSSQQAVACVVRHLGVEAAQRLNSGTSGQQDADLLSRSGAVISQMGWVYR